MHGYKDGLLTKSNMLVNNYSILARESFERAMLAITDIDPMLDSFRKERLIPKIVEVVLCISAQERDPPSLKWSDLKYVIWHQGGPICRGSVTNPRRSSPS